MTDDLTARLAAVQRAMAAPLPSPAELAAWAAEDRAMAERIHQVRPGVPLHHVLAVLETLRAVQRVDAAKEPAPQFPLPIRADGSHWYVSTYCAHGDHGACRLRCKTCDAACECGCGHPAAPSCRWPACLTEAEQQQLADDVGRGMLGEDTPLRPDPRPGCGCVDGGPGLTRDELQGLVDEQGQDLYQARDLLDFIREMCDLNDAGGTPITTTDVRGWLRYTGCGGVLVLPDEVVAGLATVSGTTPDIPPTSGDDPDIAGERQ